MAEKKNIKDIYDMCCRITEDVEDQFNKDPNAKISDSTISTLENAFEQIIDFEKLHLIMSHDQFYGCMLMSMNTKIDFSQRGPLDLKIDEEPFTIVFNPLFICKYKYSEFTGMVVSEILRLAYGHPAIYAEYNHGKDQNKHMMLEKSSDASISNMVQNDVRLDNKNNSLRLPRNAYTVSKLNDELGVTPKRNEGLQYYYRILEKFSKKNENSNGSQGEMSNSVGSNSNNNNENNSNSIATENNNKGNSAHQWEGKDSDEQLENIKSMIKGVYDSMSDEQRGNMPSGLIEQIKKLIAPPEINWKQLLRKYIGSIPQPYRKTRTRLNRRQPYRADLSGKLPKRIANVVCVFDTSGSMSSRDLQYCMNEVFNIVKDRKGSKITIIECDAEVGKVYEAKNINELQLKMSGRGGTLFTPAIEYINGDNKEAAKKWPKESGKFRDAVMVYFTDGYGEDSIPKPKTYRNLWVVLRDEKCLSLKEPYGEVKSLSMDKDWIKNVRDNQW